MKGFLKRLGEFLEDQGGAKDIKLLLGTLAVLVALVYILFVRPGDYASFATIAGVGTALLGVSALADQGKLGGPGGGASSNSSGL